MAINKRESWLTVTDLAEELGIHPSTVRLWSEKGVLPVHRTSGGHRRYLRDEVDLWVKTSREIHVVEPGDAMQSAIGKIRMQVADGRLEQEGWYKKLDENARIQYRQSGMTLVRGLISYLSSDGVDAAGEAYALGYEYASRARRYGLNSVDATRAFLFFRNILLEALINAYEEAHAPPGLAWGRMLKRLHAFTDQILVTLLETYIALDEPRS
jgi:excisionase family DNA binding protein